MSCATRYQLYSFWMSYPISILLLTTSTSTCSTGGASCCIRSGDQFISPSYTTHSTLWSVLLLVHNMVILLEPPQRENNDMEHIRHIHSFTFAGHSHLSHTQEHCLHNVCIHIKQSRVVISSPSKYTVSLCNQHEWRFVAETPS